MKNPKAASAGSRKTRKSLCLNLRGGSGIHEKGVSHPYRRNLWTDPVGEKMEPENEWTVLLIDDEADIRDVLSISLQDAGYRMVTAPDGQTGILRCREMSPRIVITDIRMPKMDGIEVLEAVKKVDPDIEVIVATGFGDMDLAIRALQLDASDFITKPIHDAALHLALKRAKERYASRKQLKDHAALLERENAKTTQELIRNLAFQKNLIENSMDGIIGSDEDNRVMIFNQSMEKLLDRSKAEVLGVLSIDAFFPRGEFDRLQAALDGTRFGGKDRLFLYETVVLRKDQRKIPVQISAVRLWDHDRSTGMVLFIRDIRALRKLEREMEDQARILHQDKMMSLGRLAASVVHEINNPLAGILNYIRLMSRSLRSGPMDDDRQQKYQRYLDLVETELSRCSQIVSNLLTFSRKSPVAFEKLRIRELIDRSVLLSRHKLELQKIDLRVRIDPDLPPVSGDVNQLQQCIINLIFNAMDAMPDGGRLNLAGSLAADQKRVVVTVEDTGCGIAEKDLPLIFEPFFTTKPEGYGVGLGLSTAYGIIQRHKGEIRVESRPGKGTVFHLELPIAE